MAIFGRETEIMLLVIGMIRHMSRDSLIQVFVSSFAGSSCQSKGLLCRMLALAELWDWLALVLIVEMGMVRFSTRFHSFVAVC